MSLFLRQNCILVLISLLISQNGSLAELPQKRERNQNCFPSLVSSRSREPLFSQLLSRSASINEREFKEIFRSLVSVYQTTKVQKCNSEQSLALLRNDS